MPDFQKLLEVVTPDLPDGQDPEYLGDYVALLAEASGKPEQQMGASVIPAVPPQWREVENGAIAFLSRTRDLRVAVLLAKARLRNGGLAGFLEAVSFVRALLERHWDTLYPKLDAADEDLTMRASALCDLAEHESVLALREAEVASVRGVGRVCVRDFAPASGEAAAEQARAIGTVLSAVDPGTRAELAAGSAAAIADLEAMEALIRTRAGGKGGLDLGALIALLRPVARELGAGAGAGASAGADADADAPGAGVATGVNTAGDGGTSSPIEGAIRSRSEVLAALDRICAYYERFEPSSPVPLLLRRSKRLVAKGFVDIVRDLVPDAAPQIEALQGKEE